MIVPLDFPKANLRLKKRNDQVFVWCILRKKELLCTPEEWVRQHVIHYLIQEKGIPEGLIASEFNIVYNGRAKRADVVVFNKQMKPLLIVECKATTVPLSDASMFQIAQYNAELNVDYLFLTNGLNHIVCRLNKDKGDLDFLDEIPNDLIENNS